MLFMDPMLNHAPNESGCSSIVFIISSNPSRYFFTISAGISATKAGSSFSVLYPAGAGGKSSRKIIVDSSPSLSHPLCHTKNTLVTTRIIITITIDFFILNASYHFWQKKQPTPKQDFFTQKNHSNPTADWRSGCLFVKPIVPRLVW